MSDVRIFISCVSAEFGSYRDPLRHYLTRPNVTVKVQEDFIVTGTETLEMLDEYIRQCEVVIHLVGDMTGAMAQVPSVAVMRERYADFAQRLPELGPFLEAGGQPLPYTQWEAWLALYHRRRLIIAAPHEHAQGDARYRLDPAEQDAQQVHLARLARVDRYPGIRFTSADQFAAEVWRSSLLDVLIEAGLIRKPSHLRYLSLGNLFKGRDALLDEITERLGPVPASLDQPVVARALTGMGGVGKTRLAIEYASRRGGGYTALLQIGADSPEALHRNLAALCATSILDLPEKGEKDEDRQRDAAIGWLNQHPGWLLILDNIDSKPAAQAVRELLPKLMGGHALLTSRLTNWSGSIQALEVKELSPDAAADFLLARTEDRRRRQADDDIAAQMLAKELGYLALALEQAGAYIAYRTDSFARYLANWQGKRDAVLAWHDPELMEYPSSVAATWQTSFEQLGEPACRLLQRLSWLAPDPVPESLLEVAFPGGEVEPDDLLDALVELKAYSLATRAADTPFFSVHKLVQEITRRAQLGEAVPARLVDALNWINQAFVGDPQDVRDWPALDHLVPHALAVATAADGLGVADPTTRLFNQLGVLLLQKAMYNGAEPLMRRALAIEEASLGADHPSIATVLSNLAALLHATNRQAEAEPLIRRALAIDEASFGADHPNVGIDLANLASLLQEANRLAEAEPLMRQALAIDEASFGADHPRVAFQLSNQALLLQATNRLAEAEPLMRRALAIEEASFGADHPRVAVELNNLALLLKETNRLAEAEPLIRRALAIEEASFGADHPRVATELSNLALLLQATNRLAEAEPLMRRALAIDDASFGADHPRVATELSNLAALMQVTNRLAEAEALMRRALAINEASFGADHPRVASELNNLALLLQATNRLAEAEPLMRRALAIDEASFGADHPRVATELNNLALLLKETNRLAEAEPLVRRALAIDEASFGADHPSVATELSNLALLLQATNRLAEAESLMRRALAIDEASFGTDHPRVALQFNNLALLLQATNRLTEAEPLMRRALAIDEASFGTDHPRVATELNNLAQLLQDTNRLSEAEPLMRRALAIDEASFGTDHPTVARDLANLAALLQETNRLAEAEPLIRQALEVDEASFGAGHPRVATDLSNLASLLQATNRLAEAEPLMRRALSILVLSLGKEHPWSQRAEGNYIALLQDMGKTNDDIQVTLASLPE